jgi:hypothetical protein
MSTVITNIDAFLDILEKSAIDGLHAQFHGSEIGDAGTAKLAQALSTGRCPTGLQLLAFGIPKLAMQEPPSWRKC